MPNRFSSPKPPASFHRLDFDALAERIFDPTSPLACEAAEVIRHAGKLQDLYERSLCTRVRRIVGVVMNAWRLRRLESARARAGQYLAHCQAANENHPGLYTHLVREAETELARVDHQIREASAPKS